MGIDKRNISRYESGHNEPRQTTVKKFADALEVTVEELRGTAVEPDFSDKDPQLYRLFEEISGLPESEREALKCIISVVVKHNRIQNAMAS